MPRTVVLDELHLTFRIPTTLSPKQVTAIRRTLTGKTFTAAVSRAVIEVMKKYPTLKPVRLQVTR
jgi:hypothetical protein